MQKEYCSSAVVIVISEKWESLGFFRKLLKKGLDEYDEMEGINGHCKVLTEQ